MNRGRSSDSLDNGDIKCSSSGSSSPTDFTSDDETSADNIFLMNGQPLNKSRSSALTNPGQPIKTAKLPTQYYRSTGPLQSRHNMLQSPARPMLGAGTGSSQHLYNDGEGIADKFYNGFYDDPATLSSDRLDPNLGLPDVAIPDVSNFDEIIAAYASNLVCDSEQKCSSERIILNDEKEFLPYCHPTKREARFSGRKISSSTLASPEPRRGMNNIAVRMCSRLVECSSLLEAIEFVDQNRDLIEDLTRIVTRDAPAFRNYDISNYQIDYSVKESFNPNFWLDREPIVTTADGNCQYHAVSISLTGSEAYTSEVRLATAVAVIDNREWFDSTLKLIDRGTVLDLVHTISRSYSWGDETTLKAVAVAINRRIFLYACNIGKKDYEMVKSLSKEELLDAFKEKKYRGGTGIHTYADPLIHVPANNYIMLFHKSEHFIAVLPTSQQLTMFEPYNPIVPVFN